AYGIDIKFEDGALDKLAEMAAKMKTGARSLVSVVEKVLIPFEKHLPSTEIRQLLVTPELVENPKEELERLKKGYNDPEPIERFEKMKNKELENIAGFIAQREKDFKHLAGLELNQDRRKLIGEIYLNAATDINTAFEDFKRMYRQVRDEEILLAEKLDITMSFDEGAVDELIRQSIESNREPGPLAFYIAKKLEYGLKLVKDRSGIEHFIISRDAIIDMEKYINNLLKKYYKDHFDENSKLITDSLEKEE
ncbi:MAG: ATPase, partial [Deltaproteobacteria bacterium]|nr:ATPase [Deltaproteobacteria bacterium]